MPVKAAVTAFLWRFGISSFKATYGRYAGDTEYSKNYLQTDRGGVRDKITEWLGHSGEAGVFVPFEVRWQGGGTFATKFNIKNSGEDHRGEVYVTDGTKVDTKRVTEPFVPGDAADATRALTGSNRLPTADDANNLLQAITASDVKPWYMLVAIAGERNALHARMILQNPPEGKEHFGLDRQPEAIQQAIEAAAPDASSIFVDLTVPVRAPEIVTKIEDAFRRSPNVLLVGPPGCGKSIALEDTKTFYCRTAWFDVDRADPWRHDTCKVFETAFHPGYSYENFVAGLAPKPGPGIQLEVRSGPLVNMAQWCRGADREGLLIIDEFNRGPAAAIFGDTLVLLDKGKRLDSGLTGSTISHPHPDRNIDVPDEYDGGAGSGTLIPKRFGIPAGLKILGAFNSSDRSVAPMDAALLRRFALVRIGPDAKTLARHLGVADFDQNDMAYQTKALDQWDASDVKRLAIHLLVVLNDRLSAILGEDHELGHSLLWEIPANVGLEQTAKALAAEFEEKVIGRLRLTLRDKDEQLAVILNAPDQGGDVGDSIAEWFVDDGRVGRLVGSKLHIRNIKDELPSQQIRRLLGVVRSHP
ncbi:AAA family ATPase [Acidiphilium acidophilum]|uniref:AAA family ATPase n=1 Tax=Acidiphilium acidophilum TaxID=76588 RepID=UPI002E8E7300|nr:AAA family ATPase [Acidiphilium acidophilum]